MQAKTWQDGSGRVRRCQDAQEGNRTGQGWSRRVRIGQGESGQVRTLFDFDELNFVLATLLQ